MSKMGIEVDQSMSRRWKDMASYLIYDIDKCLNIIFLETVYYISHLFVRKDGLDERGNFTPRDGTADQALQGSIIRVESGWIGGEVCIRCRTEKTTIKFL
jgi:hypothetical protein